MEKVKKCTNCNVLKSLDEFGIRNRKCKDGRIEVKLNICKVCNSQKSKEHYYKNKKIMMSLLTKKYLYRFLDNKGNILYIGKTNNLSQRLRHHIYGKKNLPDEAYSKLAKIQVAIYESETLRDIAEIYNINLYKPKYNRQFKYNEQIVFIEGMGNEDWVDLDPNIILNNIKSEDLVYKEGELKSDLIYKGKGIIFIRERSNKFHVYFEYKDLYEQKKRQISMGKYKNKDAAQNRLNEIKNTAIDGKYSINLTKKIILKN